MINNERQAETEVQQSDAAEVTTSSPTCCNTHVASSFYISNLTQRPSTFAAYRMLKQLDERNDGASHWMLMSLCKLLIEFPYLTVKDLIVKLEIICPNAKATVNQRFQEQGYFD